MVGAREMCIRDRIYGDVNNDGTVDDLDVINLYRYIAKWNVTVNEKAADVVPNGEINDEDAIQLARYIANWNVTIGK